MTVTDNRYPQYMNLASAKMGAQLLSCSDDFFAEMENMLKDTPAVFLPDEYTHRGKWMDGWESRRRRDSGHDWVILRLAVPGRIAVIDVDTTHFKGNAPRSVSIEACHTDGEPNANTEWTLINGEIAVNPDSHNEIEIASEQTWSHLRLNIYPDGGVARLRVYGRAELDVDSLLPGELVDLASAQNGGRTLSCSDMFFSDMRNLLMPGRGINMGDGWETKRRRSAGHDWVIIALTRPGQLKRVLLDTCHFKGNYPDRAIIEATCANDDASVLENRCEWVSLLPETKLQADREHRFQRSLLNTDQWVTHIRLSIYPDGGVSRLRVYGYPKLED